MSTIEKLVFLQEDASSRIAKGLSNFKKSPKSRLTREYVQAKLDSLDLVWGQFAQTHVELLKTSNLALLKESQYMTKEMYDTTEELYIEYFCLLKKTLPKEADPMAESEGKTGGNKSYATLPKIVIPNFSGNYNEWGTFRDLFQSLVHNQDMDKSIKMQYLKGLLGGEAEQLVRNMNITAANYDQCWATLNERYNNKRYLCYTILKRLFNQRSSDIESASFLKEILDNTTECIGALENLGIDISTWDLILNYMTALKLDPETRKQWELQSANCNGNELPTFKELQEFLTRRFRALEFVGVGSSFNKSRSPVKSFHVAQEAYTSVTCKFCKGDHELVHCKKFESEEVPTRRAFVEKQRLCFNCLGEGHSANNCRCRISCRVCHRRHHTFLHLTGGADSQRAESSGSPAEGDKGEEVPVVCFASGGGKPCSQILLASALVKAVTHKGDTEVVRALLDQGSQASYITEATVQLLGLKRTPVKGVSSGVGGNQTLASKHMVKLDILSMREGFQCVKLSLDVYVLKSITTLLPSKKAIATDWVCNLPLADPMYNTPSRIDLLLGAEVVGQVMRDGIQKQGSLLAQNTSLGWILSGVVRSDSDQQATNLITMHQVCFEEDQQLKKFCELEANSKISKKQRLTEQEQRCEKFFEETMTRDQDGRKIERLPFQTENPDMKIEKSKRIAKKRLTYLETTLNKPTDLKSEYKKVIEENEGSIYPAAAETVKGDFYMDDLLTEGDDIETAMRLYTEMNKLLETGGFKLQKWSSINKELLTMIKKTEDGIDQEDGLKLKTHDIDQTFLTAQEPKQALDVCIRKCQKENFTKEIASIDKSRNGRAVKLKGPFKSFKFVPRRQTNIIPGGRLELSSLSEDQKNSGSLEQNLHCYRRIN